MALRTLLRTASGETSVGEELEYASEGSIESGLVTAAGSSNGGVWVLTIIGLEVTIAMAGVAVGLEVGIAEGTGALVAPGTRFEELFPR